MEKKRKAYETPTTTLVQVRMEDVLFEASEAVNIKKQKIGETFDYSSTPIDDPFATPSTSSSGDGWD